MKRILFVCNDSWFFVSHRLPIARQALQDGYEVHVAALQDDKTEALLSIGCVHHNWRMEPRGKNVIKELLSFWALLVIVFRTKPDLLHLITIKPVLYGGFIARLLRVPAAVFAVSGLGAVYVSQGFRARVLRYVVKKIHRFSLCHRNCAIIFQNPDDRDQLKQSLRLSDSNLFIMNGSGVDLDEYPLTAQPAYPPYQILMAARLLRDKGIGEFIFACNALVEKGFQVNCVVAGGNVATGNPAAYSESELSKLYEQKHVSFLGHRDDVASLMKAAHIVVLPSYREGLPKVLIEAGAIGRAVVTTDVPGCRHAIENEVTGLLVPSNDGAALGVALEKLISDDNLREQFGVAGRALAEKRFSIGSIVSGHLNIYTKLLESPQRPN